MYQFVAAKLNGFASSVRVLPEALGLVFRAAPRWTVASAALVLVQGLLPMASVYLVRPLVDGIAAAARSGGGWAAARPAVSAALLIAAALLLAEVLRAAATWVRTAQSEVVQDYVAGLVHAKSVEADLAFYDSAEFFDRLHRARAEASYRPTALVTALASLLQNCITLAAMLMLLASFGWWVPLALGLGTVPAFLVVVQYAIRQHELRARTTADERRAWYYDWLLTDRTTAAEVRLFSLGSHFRAGFLALRGRLRKQTISLARGNAAAQLAASGTALAATGGCLGWMFWQSLAGVITLGTLALFYQAFQQGLGLTRSLLDNIGQLYYNSLFLGNLFEFLALKPKIVSPPNALPAPSQLAHGIRFEAVTFRYPGSSEPALTDFSLEIPAGRMIAFVGPNGAGKSTFIKLLCRFYEPDSGHITIDGTDLRQFDLEELRRRITVLFQEPVRYNATVAENIWLGDIGSAPSREHLEQAATGAGADRIVAHLPRGYENLMGKLFLEGAELSSGEWQRIALARAFYRKAPILILDEPTSAMDPWAEADWLQRFRILAQGRTSILITHRFTTAMHADIIHVMRRGRVTESGSHDALIAQAGSYARSWAEQINNQNHSRTDRPVTQPPLIRTSN